MYSDYASGIAFIIKKILNQIKGAKIYYFVTDTELLIGKYSKKK